MWNEFIPSTGYADGSKSNRKQQKQFLWNCLFRFRCFGAYRQEKGAKTMFGINPLLFQNSIFYNTVFIVTCVIGCIIYKWNTGTERFLTTYQ